MASAAPEHRGADYAALPRLCSTPMSVLDFRREGGRKEVDEGKEEKSSYLSLEALDPFMTGCPGDLLAPPPVHPGRPLQHLFTVP